MIINNYNNNHTSNKVFDEHLPILGVAVHVGLLPWDDWPIRMCILYIYIYI